MSPIHEVIQTLRIQRIGAFGVGIFGVIAASVIPVLQPSTLPGGSSPLILFGIGAIAFAALVSQVETIARSVAEIEKQSLSVAKRPAHQTENAPRA